MKRTTAKQTTTKGRPAAKGGTKPGRKRRTRRRGLADNGAGTVGTAQKRRWVGLDNVGVMLATRAAWRDNLATVLGGLMYVVVPTALQSWRNVDMTGWKGYLTSIGTNVLVGSLLREPGYVAGVLGAACAHFVYARMQDSIIRPIFGTYAFRFDPTVTTSSMSDDAAPALPAGTMLRNVAGETIALYPPSPSAANVGVEDNYQRDLGDNYRQDLKDNYQQDLKDNYQHDLRDNYKQDLKDNFQRGLRDNYQARLSDNFQTTLRDAFGGNDPWGSQLPHVFGG